MKTIIHSKRFTFKHDCDLPSEAETDDITISPYAPFTARILFNIRNYMTIHDQTESRNFFRSNASIRRERKRHLLTKRYRYVIHPFSRFAMNKRILATILWTVLLLTDPYLGSFLAKPYLSEDYGTNMKTVVNWAYITVQTLTFCDMASRFLVGFITKRTREIVLDPKQVAKGYLFSYFPVDCIPLLPPIIWLTFPPVPLKIDLILHQMHLVRYLRIKTLLGYFDMGLHAIHVTESNRKCIKIVIATLYTLHWYTCALGLIATARDIYGLHNEETWLLKMYSEREQLQTSQKANEVSTEVSTLQDYFQYLSLVMCHFFGAGTGRFETDDALEMFVLCCVLITGLIFYLYTLAQVLQLFGTVNIAETKFDEVVVQANEYMISKGFPAVLKKRIKKYYDYKFGQTFFSEQVLMDSLTDHLRMEILLYSCQNLVEKVQIFKGLSRSAVGSILALLEQEIYLSKDVITSSHKQDGKLYFILYGTCGVKLLSGKEAMHIEDGSHFGDTSEFAPMQRNDVLYVVVALEACEIYSLSKKDIKYCCKNYPEITHKLQSMAKTTAKFYNTILAMAAGDEEIKSTDIIAELRRGNILEQGIKRNLLI